MNQPKVQTDVPDGGTSPDHNPTGRTPHGIPEDQDGGEAKGAPDSGRSHTETTPKNLERAASAA